MKVLIKNGLIIDPKNKIKDNKDILIENGVVVKIGKNISDETTYVIDANKMIVSPGFVDLHANFCDPGVTGREDLKTGSLSAAKGGFTHVVLGVDNKPAPSECNVIEYIKKYAGIMPVNIYPSAALTLDREGETVADIKFLSNHGAIAFYDGTKPILDKVLLEKIMKNASSMDVILSIYCEAGDKIKVRGILDDAIAKSLSVKYAVPTDAEYEDMKENIEMARILGTKLDLAYVSAKESVDLIADAKKEGQEIYAEVQALSLILTEKACEKHGALAKVSPPLRTEADRKALLMGLKKGIIDVISSNHTPVQSDDKTCKFKDAISGAIGLETLLGICGLKLVKDEILSWEEVIEKISVIPAKMYGLDKLGAGAIDEGKIANITIFAPNEKWKFTEDSIVSKSHNTPLIGTEFIGKVKYTICNGRQVYRDSE